MHRGTRLAEKRSWPRLAGTAAVAEAARQPGDHTMQWTQPAFEDLRFGFEITMYIAAR